MRLGKTNDENRRQRTEEKIVIPAVRLSGAEQPESKRWCGNLVMMIAR